MQLLPLLMLVDVAEDVVLDVVLDVVWLCVLIVVVLQNDLLRVIDVDVVDVGV